MLLFPFANDSQNALPEEWTGMRDQELSHITEIHGSVFVHATGFIDGCKTKQGAIFVNVIFGIYILDMSG